MKPTARKFGLALMLVSLGSVMFVQTAVAQTTAVDALCRAAIASTESAVQLPPHMLFALAIVESGRAVPGTGTSEPWPWTIDVNGIGRVFDSKAAAIAAVQDAQHAGSRSIDVGCMQINLFYHPAAFVSLEVAFDPFANVAYAVRFLKSLYARTGDWTAAIAAYHSATPERGAPYAQRVAAIWPNAPQFGVAKTSPVLPLTAAALAAQVDPSQALTPAFRAERVRAAAFRLRQQLPSLYDTPIRSGALANEVDPKLNLTPAFRARMVAAAAFHHQNKITAEVQQVDALETSMRARRPARKLLAANVAGSLSTP